MVLRIPRRTLANPHVQDPLSILHTSRSCEQAVEPFLISIGILRPSM